MRSLLHPRSFALLCCLLAYRRQRLPIVERRIRYVAALLAVLRGKWSRLSTLARIHLTPDLTEWQWPTHTFVLGRHGALERRSRQHTEGFPNAIGGLFKRGRATRGLLPTHRKDQGIDLLPCTCRFPDGSIASLRRCPSYVCFPPDRDQIAGVSTLPFWARSGHCVHSGWTLELD